MRTVFPRDGLDKEIETIYIVQSWFSLIKTIIQIHVNEIVIFTMIVIYVMAVQCLQQIVCDHYANSLSPKYNVAAFVVCVCGLKWSRGFYVLRTYTF